VGVTGDVAKAAGPGLSGILPIHTQNTQLSQSSIVYILPMNLVRRLLRLQVRMSALLFLPTAIILLIAALVLAGFNWHFVKTAQHATGKITVMESRIDSDSDQHFFPHFSFITKDGSTIEVSSNIGSNPPGFEVGDSVPVLYPFDDPTAARIATTFQTYGLSIILGIIGTVFVFLGFGSRSLRRKYFPN
jgi:hypothetical protein